MVNMYQGYDFYFKIGQEKAFALPITPSEVTTKIGSNNKVVTLSLERGGYICSKCRHNEVILDEKVMKLLRLYYYVDISKISNLDIDNEVSNKINMIIDEYYDRYSGISTKSKSFLKEIDSWYHFLFLKKLALIYWQC